MTMENIILTILFRIAENSMAFFRRVIQRFLQVIEHFLVQARVRLRLSGARVVASNLVGNTNLCLNQSCPLGVKGTIIELPRDNVIFEHVKNWGIWEINESYFLASGLKSVDYFTSKRSVLIDIGANSGLVTLQAMNIAKTNNDIFVFEPIPRHISAIRTNLAKFSKVHINEFALSDKNGTAKIFTEFSNRGNSSLFDSVIPEKKMITTEIKLVDTREFCEGFLLEFDYYVIKCDTQGMDALILSRLSNRVWENCVSAVVEVWALPRVYTSFSMNKNRDY